MLYAFPILFISFFILTRDTHDIESGNPTSKMPSTRWTQNGVRWLLDAQSENGGWGPNSFKDQVAISPNAVTTDPATTAFAAMALMEAGGALDKNPYRHEIELALERILLDIEHRPDNGRLTALTSTQPQYKLGANVDASMSLDFLTRVQKQLDNERLLIRIDSGIAICIRLLHPKINPDGTAKDGGWAPVLQTALVNDAMNNAGVAVPISDSILVQGSRASAADYFIDGISSRTAGVALYDAVAAEALTGTEAREVEVALSEVVVVEYKSPLYEADNTTQGGVKTAEQIRNLPVKNTSEIAATLTGRGIEENRAQRLANAYVVNQNAKAALKKQEIWDGFGSNGGEEFLSYKLHSESLEKQNKDEWLAWRTEMEPRFISIQNGKGSWSGHHCITSPVFCTAAVLLAWFGSEDKEDLTAKR